MSETPKQLELIEGFYSFADLVATLINTEIVAALGDDADWEYWAGSDEIPAMFKENCSPEKFKRLSDLWTLRESASGYSCDLSEYDPADWAKNLHKDFTELQAEIVSIEEKNERLHAGNKSMAKHIVFKANELRTLKASLSQETTEINWEEQYEQQLALNQILITENQALINKSESKLELDRLQRDCDKFKANLQATYDDYKKSSEQEFRCLKAEIITSLRAIDLCLLASLCTENQWLTHKARNFRMRHVHQIISNEIDRFGDRKLTSYEDDF